MTRDAPLDVIAELICSLFTLQFTFAESFASPPFLGALELEAVFLSLS